MATTKHTYRSVTSARSGQTGRRRRSAGAWAALGLATIVAVALGTEPASAAKATPTGTAAFSLRLYRAIVTHDDHVNLIESPYSIAEALSMLAAGSAGNSKRQIDTAVAGRASVIDPVKRAELRTLLTTSGVGSGTEVTVANALWTAVGSPIAAPYRSTLTQQYAAQSQELPFATDADAAIKAINQWASAATKGLIQEVVGPESVDTNTAVVLTNAIYFQGRWASQFDPASTTPERFTLASGKRVNVPTMRAVADLQIGANPTVISVPFTGGYTMDIVAPTKATRQALDSAMATLHLPRTSRKYKPCTSVTVALPKWRASSELSSLAVALEALGITDVFDRSLADLSPMSGNHLAVDAVVQSAKVDVDERGTTAAAVTAISASPVSAPPTSDKCPWSVALNRPFVYVLRHVASDEIIFAGRVDDPRA